METLKKLYLKISTKIEKIYIYGQWFLILGMAPQGLSIPSDSRMKTAYLGSHNITLSSHHLPFQQKVLYDRCYSFEQAMLLWGKPGVIAEWRTIQRLLFKKIRSS